MTRKKLFTIVASVSACLAAAGTSRATILSFDDGSIAAGATLSNQYASLGVTFAPGGGGISGVVNPAGTTQGFATNTSMLVGAPGTTTAAPISGNVLHTQSGWLNEDGDAVFTMTFSSPVTFLSIDFGAVGATAGQAAIFAVNPATGTATTVGFEPATANGTTTATGIPAGATTFVVVPGSYADYVAVDNINYTLAVPEPSTIATAVAGAGLLGIALRRRSRTGA